MIINERDERKAQVLAAAKMMMTAARTAPKGKGIDVIEICTLTGAELQRLSAEMRVISAETGYKFFLRDADNIDVADAVLIVGTREQPQGLNCRRCGYATCASRPAGVPCALNTVDLGIAVGSAAAMAADLRLDTRIMYSAGEAAQRLGLPCVGCNNTLAIPLSAGSKNPFFDRKPKEAQTPENVENSTTK
jgi:uncharacterized ferredoxin-like protein